MSEIHVPNRFMHDIILSAIPRNIIPSSVMAVPTNFRAVLFIPEDPCPHSHANRPCEAGCGVALRTPVDASIYLPLCGA